MRRLEVEAEPGRLWDWPLAEDSLVEVKETDTTFDVDLEAIFFKPDEIEVKAMGDMINIHLEHVELGRGGETSAKRSIMRSYRLPKEVDMNSIRCNLDRRGMLHIHANKTH